MTTAARLTRLELKLQLRRTGVLCWVVLVLFACASFAQEPLMLRTFGVALGPQATWGISSLLLLVLIASERNPFRGSWLPSVHANCILLLILAVAQSALAFAAEVFLLGTVSLELIVRSLGCFLIAWTPLAVCAAAPDRTNTQVVFRKILMTIAAACGCGLAAAAWEQGLSLDLLLAVVLATGGALAGVSLHSVPTPPVTTCA